MSTSTIRPCPSPNGTNHSQVYLRTVLVRRDQMDRLALDAMPSEETILRREGMSLKDIQRLIDSHTGKSDIRGGTGGAGDDDPPIRRPSPAQSEDEEEQDGYKRFADNLRREHGFSVADVAEALKHHALDVARDRRAKGHDVLPKNASGVAARGGGMGGHTSGGRTAPVLDNIDELMSRIGHEGETEADRAVRRHDELHGSMNKIVDHGLDRMRRGGRDRSDEEIDKVHELLKRFEPEAGYAPDRRRHAMDSKPAISEKQKDHFAKTFPDIAKNMAKIGNMMNGDAPGVRDAPWEDKIG